MRLNFVSVLWLCLPLGAATGDTNVFYQRLHDALQQYQGLQQTRDWPSVAQGPTLQAGDTGPRVAALRRRLSVSGDLPGVDAGSSDDFDAGLRRALMHFQGRHGLAVDGVVGPATLAALNTSLASRIAQMQINLQRMGEFELTPTGIVIVINVPAYELLWLEDQEVIWRTRVQVGTSETPTPLFQSELRRLVVNPSWAIPHSIAAEEMLPRIQNDPGYLATQNIEVFDSDGQPVAEDTIEWSVLSSARFPYKLIQQPCALNSLGRVKFIFPNEHDVYLHDTPHKILFEQSRRAFSHGCIRAEHSLDLAHRLLRTDGWNSTEVKRVLTSPKSHNIGLKIRPLVAIVYWTAFVDDNGAVQFRDDIYGHDIAAPAAGAEQ